MYAKNLFETHECRVCLVENETQEHIYVCNEIWKLKGENEMKNYPIYEKIVTGNRQEKIRIAKQQQQHQSTIWLTAT